MNLNLESGFLSICVLAIFLLVGAALRYQIRLLQILFLPASLIGGVLLLLCGPEGLGTWSPVQFPTEWIHFYAALPGILIIPIVAAVPLSIQKTQSARSLSLNTVNMTLLILLAALLQTSIGTLIGAFFQSDDTSIYATFGLEAPSGFIGGHPVAPLLGQIFKDLNLSYWEVVQGITLSYATFGLILGNILGVLAIRIYAQRGQISGLHPSHTTSKSWLRGFEPDIEQQASAGRESSHPSSIDAIAFTLALILSGCGISILIKQLLIASNLPILSDIPVWGVTIICMWVIWLLMKRLGLSWLVDPKLSRKFVSTLTDFAVIAALATMPIKALAAYTVPILLITVLSTAGTFFLIWFVAQRVFSDAPIERAALLFGTCTGVFLTGLMLVKMCDPKLKSPAVHDGSLAFAIAILATFALIPLGIQIGLTMGPAIISLASFGVFIGLGALMYVLNRQRLSPERQ